MGDVSQALLQAAQQQPGPVRELAARAQVGYGVARYTATRLVSRGLLQLVGDTRPMVLREAEVCSLWHLDAGADLPPPVPGSPLAQASAAAGLEAFASL